MEALDFTLKALDFILEALDFILEALDLSWEASDGIPDAFGGGRIAYCLLNSALIAFGLDSIRPALDPASGRNTCGGKNTCGLLPTSTEPSILGVEK